MPRTGRPPVPHIRLLRPHYEKVNEPTRGRNAGAPKDLPPPDLLYELVTLAHEFGHFESWRHRTPREQWLKYDAVTERRGRTTREVRAGARERGELGRVDELLRAALQQELNDAECAMILEEEALAWSIGREVLAECGFADWTAYDDRERLRLHNHRYRLGLDELWPEDVASSTALN